MKKLTASLGVLLIFSATVFGQYGRQHNDKYGYERSENNKSSRFDNNKHKHLRGNQGSNGVNSYQRQAYMRIQEGVSRGLITKREERKLIIDFNKIASKENRYLLNGRLSRKENNDLKRDLLALNKKIDKESRDFQRNRRRK